MRKLVLLALVFASATAAIAAPGVTTTNVNFRDGPGTNYSVIKTLPAGTAIDIGNCDDAGSWCAVTVEGANGFLSGQYLKETEDPEAWPRTYETAKGRIVLYQPQFTEWKDFKSVEALVAAEYLKAPDAQPVFGVIGLQGKTSYDEDAEQIVITDITISSLDFSSLGRDDLAALSVETGKLLPTGPITVPELRVTASLAQQKRMTDVSGLSADPPPIFVSTSPARLLQTDGAPAYAPVKGKPGLSFVVNTNWDLFRLDDGNALFLRDDTHWLTAPDVGGPWTPVTELPQLLKELPADGNWDDARAALPPQPYADGQAPKIVTTEEPSELILFDGEPALEDVPDTTLQWASNTETDVFLDKAGEELVRAPVGPLVPLSRQGRALDVRNGGPARRLPENPAGRALLCRPCLDSRDIRKRRSAAQGQHPHHRPGRKGLDHAGGRLCGGGAIRADRGDRSRLRGQHHFDRDRGGRPRISCFRTASGSWPTVPRAPGVSPPRLQRRFMTSLPRPRSTTPPTSTSTTPSRTPSGTATRWDI